MPRLPLHSGRARWGVAIALVLAIAGIWVWSESGRSPEAVPQAGPALDVLLGSDSDAGEFAAVTGPRPLALPADHGAHEGFRSEVWNLFGRLRDPAGRQYAFQVNLIRLALVPQNGPPRESAWAAKQIYGGRLSLVAEDDNRVLSAVRLSRAAVGLAGASSEPPTVWIEDWSLQAGAGEAGVADLKVAVAGDEIGLSLALEARKPPLDEAALDGSSPGGGAAAFHVYVLPRLKATGTLTIAGEALAVSGEAWLDHGWGAIPAASGQLVLNRLAVQLDDDRELTCIDFRRRDGTGTPITSCLLILADGRVQDFRRREIDLDPVTRWRSPQTAVEYPIAWQLAIRPLDLQLALTPIAPDQELDPSMGVWSGALDVTGRQGRADLGGNGVLTLSGYGRAGEGM